MQVRLSDRVVVGLFKGWLGLIFVFVFVIWFFLVFALVARVWYCLIFVCLEFQIIRFVISTFTPIFFIEISFILQEVTGLGFSCFVVINSRVLSANRVDLGFFLFHIFFNYTPPPQAALTLSNEIAAKGRRDALQQVWGGGGVPISYFKIKSNLLIPDDYYFYSTDYYCCISSSRLLLLNYQILDYDCCPI